MNKIIFSISQPCKLANSLAKQTHIPIGTAEIREFPDGETYIRIDSDVKDKSVILICTLDHPNAKIIPLLFMAKTLKNSGAANICLISPYLSYMRQDKQFKPGEAVTSILFAELLSRYIDKLITIDPHLHRIKNLSEIYTTKTQVFHATHPIADWIKKHVKQPILIGPDEESRQWVADIAEYTQSPYVIINKTRKSDRDVIIDISEIKDTHRTPVLVDDIISTGSTMLAVIQQLQKKHFKNPICIAVHALFDESIYHKLISAGAENVITCNTIEHTSNQIDISLILLKTIE